MFDDPKIQPALNQDRRLSKEDGCSGKTTPNCPLRLVNFHGQNETVTAHQQALCSQKHSPLAAGSIVSKRADNAERSLALQTSNYNSLDHHRKVCYAIRYSNIVYKV